MGNFPLYWPISLVWMQPKTKEALPAGSTVITAIGHFRISLSLYFKASLRAKSLLWMTVFIHIEIRTNYHNKNFASTLALKEILRGTRKLFFYSLTFGSLNFQNLGLPQCKTRMNLIIAVFYRCLSSSEEGPEISRLNGVLNPNLCDAAAGLNFRGLSRRCLNGDEKLRWSNSFILSAVQISQK